MPDYEYEDYIALFTELDQLQQRNAELEAYIHWIVDGYGYQDHPLTILEKAKALIGEK